MKRKVFILGIDGAELELIRRWTERDKLPHFQKLLKEGSWGKMKSTIPPLTPCAWSSFMTGKNPGKHGQFSFYKLNEKYELDINWGEHRTEKAIWKILSDHGKKCCVMNVPFTYPPEKVNGYLISGFMTPSLENNFTYPVKLKNELIKKFPRFRLTEKTRYSDRNKDRESYMNDILELTDLHGNIAEYLYKKENWDFFMVTFMGADHMQHWYWKYMDETHPQYEDHETFSSAIYNVYSKIDGILGRMMDYMPEETVIIIMSDHGFGKYLKDVNINEWLKQKEYLKIKTSHSAKMKKILISLGIDTDRLIKIALKIGGAKLSDILPFDLKKKVLDATSYTWKDINWKKTKAYSFGYYGSIFLNKENLKITKNKNEHDLVRKEINEQLQELKDPETDEKVVDEIWFKEDIYKGKKTNLLPDISFSMKNFSYASSMTFAFPSGNIFSDPKTLKSGEHRLYGTFIIYGNGIKRGNVVKNVEIIDLAPTILSLMNIEPPKDMDGKVLQEVLEK